jgi:hypothetical protein
MTEIIKLIESKFSQSCTFRPKKQLNKNIGFACSTHKCGYDAINHRAAVMLTFLPSQANMTPQADTTCTQTIVNEAHICQRE